MAKKKNINWLWIALAVTAAYGLASVWLLGLGHVATFITSNPTSLNAIGDFTAGMFAPIAVIWLVAAVMTQRQELEEAREQSRLTQEQFAENQRVVDEQLKTINSQNALLRTQHQQSVENAIKAYRLSLYDKRIIIYQKFIDIGEEYSGDAWGDEGYWRLVNLAQEAAFVFDKSIEDWLNDMANEVVNFQQYRDENPIMMDDDGYGNLVMVKSKENDEIISGRNKFSLWLDEQFYPDVRNEKFWPFMFISDKPYADG
ncbi:membrane protein implicated in regulation of membrane protease activity [Mycoplana sp. BE70]|uniref:hypothetical protein n=1 Tax=Mycoplana sp. BE70 TaxID=2817775 RepID=UPI002856736D|nr:hypothetical protein [Mycoplana sp. BE70]MDR6757196.1 membrane protein implicated in regulation of membrane protease activity [Mycoplana sp. BE70]